MQGVVLKEEEDVSIENRRVASIILPTSGDVFVNGQLLTEVNWKRRLEAGFKNRHECFDFLKKAMCLWTNRAEGDNHHHPEELKPLKHYGMHNGSKSNGKSCMQKKDKLGWDAVFQALAKGEAIFCETEVVAQSGIILREAPERQGQPPRVNRQPLVY